MRSRMIMFWILAIALTGCASKNHDALNSLDGRMRDLQRALEMMSKRQEGIQNDIMVLQDQMETTRIQVQKFELNGGKAKPVRQAEVSRPPLIEIRRIDVPSDNREADNNPLGLYRQAYSLYENKKLFEAQEKFDKFVKANPQHDYADNAIYWMGEIYYDQKEYILAITEFKRVLKDYPNSNKTADAWLKIGLAYERLDDPKKAQLAYKSISTQYPYSSAANLANERLLRIQKMQ